MAVLTLGTRNGTSAATAPVGAEVAQPDPAARSVPPKSPAAPGLTPAIHANARRRTTSTVNMAIPTSDELQNFPRVVAQIAYAVREIVLVDGESCSATSMASHSYRVDIRVLLQESGTGTRANVLAAAGEINLRVESGANIAEAAPPARVTATPAPSPDPSHGESYRKCSRLHPEPLG